jgi:hypothetical protein
MKECDGTARCRQRQRLFEQLTVSCPKACLKRLNEFQDCTESLHKVLGSALLLMSTWHIKIVRSSRNFMRVISPWEREHLLLSV